jgi:hypothetical protein
MKKLARTDGGRGIDQQILKKLLRLAMEYGIAAWATSAKAHMDSVNAFKIKPSVL